ncbi:bile acid:sodium symporter family protein [Sandaracinus amylolyticus]|uniref:bile acid:sodium symporter family protein n=1 Tax=Sandaracinus amylolyticus TaxID=927083 RepID=UPI001F259D4A|nr:bile acid:sodium symporter [Sandaracinus amylolyticus]UJR82992.1 Hypothetical protein I5071_50570 [Sandaracinus amylolyticus]
MTLLERVVAALLVVASMAAVGLDLDAARARSILAQRGLLVRAMIATLVVVPLTAAAVLALAPIDADTRVGLTLAACAPGGASATVLTLRARGNAALTAALVVLATLLSALATPALVALLTGGGSRASLVAAASGAGVAIALQLVPLGLAVIARAHLSGDVTVRAARIANAASNLLLLSLIAGIAIARWRSVLEAGPWTFGASVLLTLVGVMAAQLLGRGAERASRVALGVSTGVRSLSLALALAATVYPAPRTTEAILVYGLAMYLVVGVAAEIARRADR